MKKFSIIPLAAVLSITLLNGCSSHEHRHTASRTTHDSVKQLNNYGTVSSIEILTVDSRPSGGGAVLGAVLGAVVGHQVGGGSGKDLATGLGAVGGAVAGNNIEKRNGNDSEIYRITVRLENGARQEFDYTDINGLRVGDRVKVEDGQIYRL